MTETDRDVIERFGIDAEGTTTCHFCWLRHYSGMACPPVLPAGTEWDQQ